MIKRFTFLLIVLVGVLLFIFGFVPRVKRFFEIDKCLDRGGRWNYEKNICEYSDTLTFAEELKPDGGKNNAKIDSNHVRIEKARLIDLNTGYEERILTNEEFMDNMTDGGGELIGYYSNGQIEKVSLWVGLSYGISTYDYYFENETLIYVHETFKQFEYVDSTGSFNYSKTEQTYRGKYYFMNKVLYDYETTGHNRFESDEIDPEKVILEEVDSYIEKLMKRLP
ncbi:hypothetical protein [Marinifilum caeruleilacunae]|uniref:Uncharacterized protein n=1 Tax=Marinifilum caeruleilacunae TaxID=2499076 RepID=A0ABX1WWE6_9BACT|nr:hypothetical protein [Marinifilum caeruleilacunae]NOU60431.1 hypothetical protein [Marinifilum caeruleilacunae]